MIVIISWVLLGIGVILFSWFFSIRSRGSVRYWIREVEVEPMVVLGQRVARKGANCGQVLTDANAVVRSLDRRTRRVYRRWDGEELFLGLVLNRCPDEEVPEGYELLEVAGQKAVRLSGGNRLDEVKPQEALAKYAEKKGLRLDLDHPVRLSGQSFSLFQWEVKSGGEEREEAMISRWMEWTYQLRDNLVWPLLATWLSLALIGTGQMLLFAIGIILIVFLSGACKFVLVHQMTDEADEIHLQNY